MLELKNITKEYKTGDNIIPALKGVSLSFRENEFVSILGASGCGKTTLLNIVGGLDRYTDGDLIINGRSTKLFRDGDWDVYRNHSIGFVFQSYNLIPHQDVLANVELALTLSGVSKSERRTRAEEALKKVGLGDQLHKKPNQMSGGQMQRVAIARALVNDPSILLADEPTGALDTQTSVQIMELLKEVAEDRLVIMVTHNPELADLYSTRIIRLSDGLVIDDSNPITEDEFASLSCKDQTVLAELQKDKKALKAITKKKSMSFRTAVSLSMKNLMTKKARTILTSFAGSIGIIGIALILALSSGIRLFINQVQEDTLSTYPLSIKKEAQDMTAMMSAMTSASEETVTDPDPNLIYVDDSLGTMMSAINSTVSNNLTAFKAYIESNPEKINDYVSDIQYTYDFDLQAYTADGKTKLGLASMLSKMGDRFAGMSTMMESSGMGGSDIMSEMINNQELLDQQYEIVKGNWPKDANEVVLVVGKNNQISKMTLYMMGVLPQDDLEGIIKALMQDGDYDTTPIPPYSVDDFMGMKFKILNSHEFYTKSDIAYADNTELYVWNDVRKTTNDDDLAKFITENGTELTVSGIIRPRAGATATSISGAIGYTKALTDLILEESTQSEVIAQQKANPTVNVLTGRNFEKKVYNKENIGDLIRTIDTATMNSIYDMMTSRTQEIYAGNPPVKDQQSFFGFFSFMTPEQRVQVVGSMIDIAAQLDATKMPMFYGAVNTFVSGINANSKEDVLKFLPSFTGEESMKILGTLFQLCEPAIQQIYDGMNSEIMQMNINENSFLIMLQMMDDASFAEFQETLYKMAPQTDATLESTLKLLGDAEKAAPASINFYAKDFKSKDAVEQFIKDYNNSVDEDDRMQYTDIIGILMSSVTIIVDVISYVLIAFVSISLIVSSIMIGIITNISVLERTKEIGILRSIGASKKDISRVFNAETFIIGLAAGILGIALTLFFCLPINALIQAISGFKNVKAVLPPLAAVILILISMLLTVVAGLIPAKKASKKDPVVALRTE